MKKICAVILTVCLFTLMLSSTLAENSFVMAGFDASSNIAWENKLFFKRMEEQTGIHLILKQGVRDDAWHQELQQMLTGNDMPDVLFKADLTSEEINDYYRQGLLIDLRPYLAEYAPTLSALLKEHPEWENVIRLPDGAIVTLPCINPLQNNNAIWINTAWLANLGLDMPSTADELTEVLRAFRDRDPNRNGRKDEVPLTFVGMWDLRWLGHAFGLNMNDYYLTLGDDGLIRTDLMTAQNRSFLEWLHLLWSEKLIDHSGFSTVDTLKAQEASEDTATYGIVLGPTPLTLISSKLSDQYAVMPPLTYEGKQVYRELQSEAVRGAFAITSHCAEPEKMVAWADYLYTEEGGILIQCGREGEEYVWNEDGKWEWVQDANTVAETVLDESTVTQGGTPAGFLDVEFQLKFENRQTRELLEQLRDLHQISTLPVPSVSLDRETSGRIAELQAKIAPFAENCMSAFVNGDTELNDETWTAFTDGLLERGIDRMVSEWQNVMKD